MEETPKTKVQLKLEEIMRRPHFNIRELEN